MVSAAGLEPATHALKGQLQLASLYYVQHTYRVELQKRLFRAYWPRVGVEVR